MVAGSLAGKPGNGGEAWVRLTWALGLAELGLPVHLVESADLAPDDPGVGWFESITGWAGLAERATLLDVRGETLVGPGRAAVADLAADGAVLVDLSGTLRDAALVAAFRRRCYVDLDPGWTQLWDAAGLLGDALDRYDSHLTVGEAVPRCGLPLSGRRWRAIRPAVLLSAWPMLPPTGQELTTVGSWRSPSGTLTHLGRELGGKARQWRPLAELPAQVPQPCAAVVAAHPADAADLDLLRAGGWSLRDPAGIDHPRSYREFVQASAGELSVAQQMYAATGCGWTSDRTAAYLSSGRPVVVQDTGAGRDLTGSPAWWTFRTRAEAAAACRDLAAADRAELSVAARTLAERAFATEVVLPQVLELAGAR